VNAGSIRAARAAGIRIHRVRRGGVTRVVASDQHIGVPNRSEAIVSKLTFV
jgi:hypothetical protein